MQESTKRRFDARTPDAMARFESESGASTGKDTIWISIVTLSSIAFSIVLACATPFAALGALAGTRMRQGPALALVAAAWAANQLIGYFVLSYPRTWDSFAWGAAIGIAALLATIAARRAAQIAQHPVASALYAFAAAFAVYELALFTATAVLPSSAAAFSFSVVAPILAINAGAFAGLLVIQRFAVWLGLQEEAQSLRPALGA